MKYWIPEPLGLLLLAAMCLCLPGCSTTVTRTTMPDGTIVEVTARASDPVAIQAACEVATEVLPLLDHLADQKGGQADTVIKQPSPRMP